MTLSRENIFKADAYSIIMSKQDLAVELSKFKVFDDAKQNLEQYSTDSEVAADILWSAHMQDWIKDKSIIDLGAGTGILGIGCLLIGAKKVTFIEIDKDSIAVLNKNIEILRETFDISAEIIVKCADIKTINALNMEKADVVVQNPPFGTQEKNMDALFLEKAMLLSDKIITMHKTVTRKFIENLAEKQQFQPFRLFSYNYPLKMTMPQHRKEIEHIKVSCWFLIKNSYMNQ
jgi:putative methylase